MTHRYLIGLLTCHAHRERDLLCLETWVPVARQLGMRVVFLIGEGRFIHDPTLDGDYLRCPCPDDYRSLPQRTRCFFRWALTQPDWDSVLKADNDSLVIPGRLAALDMGDAEYRGCEPGHQWRGYGSGGGGYLLTRRAVEIVAERLNDKTGAEDQLVGRYLRRAGVKFHQDARFVPWGSNDRRPKPDNDLITAHKIPESLWRETWEALRRQVLLIPNAT